MRVLLRVFARASGADDVRRVGEALLAALREFAPVPSCAPERYWKEPQWYEYTFELAPAGVATFDAVLARFPAGWTSGGRDVECDAVWNPGGGDFLLPEVTWAQLLFVHRTRAHVLYLRSNCVALSRESVSDWRDLQELHDDYMASLGPWTLEEITDHFATQFGRDAAAWPLSPEEIENFMTRGTDLILRARSCT